MHFIPKAIIDHAAMLRVNGMTDADIATNLSAQQVPEQLGPLVIKTLDSNGIEAASNTRPTTVVLFVAVAAIAGGAVVSIVVGQKIVDAGLKHAGAIGGVIPGLAFGAVVYFAGRAILRALNIPLRQTYTDTAITIDTPLDKTAVDARGCWVTDDGSRVTRQTVLERISTNDERLVSDETNEVTVVAYLDDVADYVRKQYRLENDTLTEVRTGPIANSDRLAQEQVSDSDVARVARDHGDVAAVRMYRLIHDVGVATAEAAVEEMLNASRSE
jgi:hypothetical protein